MINLNNPNNFNKPINKKNLMMMIIILILTQILVINNQLNHKQTELIINYNNKI
jgi:hypothetical protein